MCVCIYIYIKILKNISSIHYIFDGVFCGNLDFFKVEFEVKYLFQITKNYY